MLMTRYDPRAVHAITTVAFYIKVGMDSLPYLQLGNTLS